MVARHRRLRASAAQPPRQCRVRVVAFNTGALLIAVSGTLAVPDFVAVLGWAVVLAAAVGFLGLVIGGLLRPAARPAVGGIALSLVMTLVPRGGRSLVTLSSLADSRADLKPV